LLLVSKQNKAQQVNIKLSVAILDLNSIRFSKKLDQEGISNEEAGHLHQKIFMALGWLCTTNVPSIYE